MKSKSLITLLVIIAGIVATISTPALAGGKDCGLAGVWTGYVDNPSHPSVSWTAILTASDQSGRSGTMLMHWDRVRSELLFSGTGVTHLSPGSGVWQRDAEEPNKYTYTWYSKGLTANKDEFPVFSVRVSGIAVVDPTNCNKADLQYYYEAFWGNLRPEDMPAWDPNSNPSPIYTTAGTGGQVRMPPPALPQLP